MRYTGSYALLLSLHLIGALVLIGPLGYVTAAAGRLVRDGDVKGLTQALRTTRVFSLGSLVVVALGTVLLERDPTQLPRDAIWVSASYALWLVAVVLNLVVVVPALRGALVESTEGRPADRFAARVGAAGGLSALCWLVIVVLMVYKPGQ